MERKVDEWGGGKWKSINYLWILTEVLDKKKDIHEILFSTVSFMKKDGNAKSSLWQVQTP